MLSGFSWISGGAHGEIEEQIIYFLHKFTSDDTIPSELYNYLHVVSGSAPSILYGSPKIDKPDFKNLYEFCTVFAACDFLQLKSQTT